MLETQNSTTLASVKWQQLLEEVYRRHSTYEFTDGVNIPLQSHDVWIVCRGIVQLSTVDCDRKEAILGLVYPEMLLGLPFTQIASYTATALSDVVLMRISLIELEQLPVLAQGVLLQLNRRLQQTEALLALNHRCRVSDRLEKLLLLLKQEVGEQTSAGTRIGVRLSHQQLANLIGSTRVTTTRVLGVFRKEGWLSIDKTRHFVIHDSAVSDGRRRNSSSRH